MTRLFGALICVCWAACVAAQEMTFTLQGNGGNCTTCEWIEATGTITPDTPARFEAFQAEWQTRADVVLHSAGGDLAAALALGRLIRTNGNRTAIGQTILDEYGSKTVAPGTCESACAFAFMGGSARTVADPPNLIAARSGTLGVHRFFRREGTDLPSAAAQQIMGQLLLFVLDMGIDPAVLARASATPADSMYYFSLEEAAALGLQTAGAARAPTFAPEGDGLSVAWEMVTADGRIARRARVYCSDQHRGWVLRVTELGATDVQQVGFDPADPIGMALQLGDDSFPYRAREILDLSRTPDGVALTVRIRADLRRFSGMPLGFTATTVRAFGMQLSAQGTVPEARVLGVLQRACVS